ncbi:response regulator transcription factor [Leifsonia poae]|uniref:response regulator transcription factor n=1 Tax=Leifsonia poae TaxID=110933 RepID=UPI003D68D85B
MVAATERGPITLTRIASLISRSIPCDHVLYVELDFAAADVVLTDLVNGHRFTNTGILVTEYGMHPLTTSYLLDPSDLTPRRASDVTSQRAWEATAAYAEVFRPDRGRFQLSMVTSLHAPVVGRGWTLTRSSTDFDDDDLEVATELLPLLAVITNRVTFPGGVAAAPAVLTGRERAIVSALAEGWTSGRISYELSISEGTVRKHIEHVYRKLGVTNRVLAVQRATELELL